MRSKIDIEFFMWYITYRQYFEIYNFSLFIDYVLKIRGHGTTVYVRNNFKFTPLNK